MAPVVSDLLEDAGHLGPRHGAATHGVDEVVEQHGMQPTERIACFVRGIQFAKAVHEMLTSRDLGAPPRRVRGLHLDIQTVVETDNQPQLHVDSS
jgi:hypothetical protein